MPKTDKRQFWKDYIDLIGEDNFQIINNNGMNFIQSPFWVGPDPSEAIGGEAMLTPLIEKAKSYYQITKCDRLGFSDLSAAFMGLHKQYYDRELLSLIMDNRIEMTDEEFWQFIIKIWTRQEFNGTGDRRERWIQILSHRAKVAFLTAELPQTFVAYRAGDLSGLSWTLDLEIAQWFQARFRDSANSDNIPIHKKTFTIDEAVFFTNNRREQEVVILPDN